MLKKVKLTSNIYDAFHLTSKEISIIENTGAERRKKKVTNDDVRAWCRKKYGSDWWQTEDKADRKKEARKALE